MDPKDLTPPTDADRPQAPGRRAHRADGSDDSASFEAAIADEGTIPDADPAKAGNAQAD